METVDLGFTKLDIHDGFAIGRTREGKNITLDDHLKVKEVLNRYLTPPYAIIIDEVNQYSVDIDTLLHIRKDPEICCVGVVYHRFLTRLTLVVGAKLLDKPVFFSTDESEVRQWIVDKRDEYGKQQTNPVSPPVAQ